MYVWLLVTLAVAVGVLMLAGILSPADRDDSDDGDDAAPTSAWSALWQDFLSATATTRARLARLRHRATPDAEASAPRATAGRTAGHPRAGQTAAAPASPAPAAAATRAATTAPRTVPPRPATSRLDRDPAESNTSFEEFFEATATSEPAYLDAAQLSDALHSLRR